MERTCKICTTAFDYCPTCAVKPSVFKKAGYCGEDCYHISMAIQEYKGGVISAEEAIITLESCGIDAKELQPKIEELYLDVLDAVTPAIEIEDEIIEEVVPDEDVEVVVEIEEDMTISEEE
jgi:hypothetical protein